ncbi:bifunctional riboflavin kinase/FAD synthetase [Gracilibacillus caseinilyticus]|uniref:Riboflavin biosynthesis protein n=1 Tax=Gracilibacillus caseinilyticus TaxID=2932256 RepID=A0ABY4ETT6_9BACI|nr:bifunctional riboflavin kinase/FAD synthetase [Gracilibacillus caseinilyticus]UOQ47830.1 bifunctional riboflavin kinase/FAD synthetase [Gracilibacillus caseinilyticus]
MEVTSLYYPHSLQTNQLPAAVAAIGFFDGVHKGHQKVIDKAKQIAHDENKHAAVITFDPHPSVVLQQKKDQVKYITPIEHKIKRMEMLGVDNLYIIRFDQPLAQLSPQAFIEHFIVGLNISHLVAGYDFTFGHKGAGNMDNIHSYTANELAITKISRFDHQEEKISSTRIRESLQYGEMEKAEVLLGRPFALTGEVVHGDKRGRTIGYPTANLKIADNYFLPKIGVYAVEVQIGETFYYGMANLGYNPTFTDDRENTKIEVHIFDFNENIYGDNVTVYWKKYIRDEEKFTGIEELVDKLKEDEHVSREFFAINH